MARQRRDPRELPPIHPNAGVRARYQARLERLVNEMAGSVQYWVTANYRANTPEMAADASPATEMRLAMGKLSRRWQRKFNALSREMAAHFATSAAERVDFTLGQALDKANFTVKFRMSPAMNDVLQATVNENVALIKSIPQKYLSQVEGSVMRSVSAGRDIAGLSKELQEQHGVTARRAAFIARDQNNKATAAFTRVRQEGLGMTEAKWRHSGAPREPRPEHLAFSGKIYNVKTGAFLEGKWVWPGTEIRCGCISVPLLPKLTPGA